MAYWMPSAAKEGGRVCGRTSLTVVLSRDRGRRSNGRLQDGGSKHVMACFEESKFP